MILREWYVIFIKENFALNKANRFAARFFINPTNPNMHRKRLNYVKVDLASILRFADSFPPKPSLAYFISAIQLSNEENLGMARYRFRVFEYRPI